jgi:hypothetical protein
MVVIVASFVTLFTSEDGPRPSRQRYGERYGPRLWTPLSGPVVTLDVDAQARL